MAIYTLEMDGEVLKLFASPVENGEIVMYVKKLFEKMKNGDENPVSYTESPVATDKVKKLLEEMVATDKVKKLLEEMKDGDENPVSYTESPVATDIPHDFAHHCGALAVLYDTKPDKYVVVATHSPNYEVGDVIN